MALSNEPLIKLLKAKDIGDGLHAAATESIDWTMALTMLGYNPDDFTEETFKKSNVKTLILDAPRNKVNRGFNLGDTKRWAIQMGKGNWVQNGQPFAYDTHGQIVTAQHRLAALLLLTQQWMRGKLPVYLEKLAKARNAPTIPVSVIFGVSAKKHVADTADTGRSRTLADVLFRADLISGKGRTESEKVALVRALAVAARLVWLRAGGKAVRNGPKFDQAEGLAFAQDKHPTLVKTLEYIQSLEENSGGGISTFITIGVAAGLMYLMSTSTTVWESGELSFDNDEKAEEFWALFVKPDGHADGSPIAALRDFYTRANKAGNRDRDETNNAAIKAWLAFLNHKKIKWTDLKTGKDESAHTGGLDISAEEREKLMSDGEMVEDTEPTPEPEPAKKAAKGKGKGKPAAAPAKTAPKKRAAKKPAKAKPAETPKDDDVVLIPDDQDDSLPSDDPDGEIQD